MYGKINLLRVTGVLRLGAIDNAPCAPVGDAASGEPMGSQQEEQTRHKKQAGLAAEEGGFDVTTPGCFNAWPPIEVLTDAAHQAFAFGIPLDVDLSGDDYDGYDGYYE